MTKILAFITALSIIAFQTSAPHPVSTVDFVKIRNGKIDEAIFFYKNNWQVYREIAAKKGYIKSYQLLFNKSPDSGKPDIMLVTTYKDSTQFKQSEPNFAEIIKSERPSGPLLLNDLKPADFRENVSSFFMDEIAAN